jgi:hypothetical protein
MHNCAVTEDPAVLDEAADDSQLKRGGIVAIAEHAPEVLQHLVVRRRYPPHVVDHVPGQLDRGVALRGEPEVEQHEPAVRQRDVLVAQVAVDERRAVGAEGGGQRGHVLDELEHCAAHVGIDRLAEGLPRRLELLRQDVHGFALALGDGGDREREPVALGREVRNIVVPKLRPHRRRGCEHEAVLLTGERGGRVEELGAHVAHHDPPGLAVALRGHDRRVHRGRHAREHAVREEQRLATRVARGAAEPVRAGHDPLGDQCAPVGEHEAVDAVPGPAARRERDTLGDLAQVGEELFRRLRNRL